MAFTFSTSDSLPHSQEKANLWIKNVWFYFMSKQESIVYWMITVNNLNVFLISGDKNTLQLSKSHLSSGCWFNVALSCTFWVLVLCNTTTHIIYFETQLCMKIFSIFDRMRLPIHRLCLEDREPWLKPVSVTDIIWVCQCGSSPPAFPLWGIVVPGIISFTKCSLRSKVKGQEKTTKVICSPAGQLLKSIWSCLVSQEAEASVSMNTTDRTALQGIQVPLFSQVGAMLESSSLGGSIRSHERLCAAGQNSYCLAQKLTLVRNMLPPRASRLKQELEITNGWYHVKNRKR